MTEHFETFDDDGHPTGLVARDVVHNRGLWHRSAHVFLFDERGALYVQRRSADKDLFADRWDFSVGEHLTPGETYLQSALRGLHEELGITDVALEPLGGIHRAVCRMDESGILDRELQQAFRGRYTGPVVADPVEVAAVSTLFLDELDAWMLREPEAFTPWFSSELERLRPDFG